MSVTYTKAATGCAEPCGKSRTGKLWKATSFASSSVKAELGYMESIRCPTSKSNKTLQIATTHAIDPFRLLLLPLRMVLQNPLSVLLSTATAGSSMLCLGAVVAIAGTTASPWLLEQLVLSRSPPEGSM
jgi:hypothetical protein